jgi:hypothetical protein
MEKYYKLDSNLVEPLKNKPEPRKNYLIGYIVYYVGGIYMNTDIIS